MGKVATVIDSARPWGEELRSAVKERWKARENETHIGKVATVIDSARPWGEELRSAVGMMKERKKERIFQTATYQHWNHVMISRHTKYNRSSLKTARAIGWVWIMVRPKRQGLYSTHSRYGKSIVKYIGWIVTCFVMVEVESYSAWTWAWEK
jgi:hypothetical protein